MDHHAWHVIGGDQLAEQLRHAGPYVQPSREMVVITDAQTIPKGAIATGRAMIVENAGAIAPHLLAFEAVDEVRRAAHAGEIGMLYGCYGSYRVPRGTDQEHVALDALLPLVAATLEIVPGDVTSVWARKASLLAEGDAWFVTLNIDAAIVTLEALATTDPPYCHRAPHRGHGLRQGSEGGTDEPGCHRFSVRRAVPGARLVGGHRRADVAEDQPPRRPAHGRLG